MAEEPHNCFTASSTAYLRNLDHEDRRAECFAIHYGKPPVRNEGSGTTTLSLRYPLLLVTSYVEKPNEVADRVAAILNKHWDSFDD